ncbi:MAG TPA: carboxypeptidase-like regulatory domain-containing protein [Kofleriaceae bacterium]|jgi:hypothetical protein|nr:carboxypeptidase-like regulatory domain-containing protein [Kofleriaceae bacterium]
MIRRTRAARPAPLAPRRPSLLLALALGIAAVALAAAPAAAQIAAALGKPLPSPDLPVGTVSVRVVAGSAAAPVVGTDVTLVVNGTPREARTDSAGRATFPGLPVGATVVAKALDEDKAEHPSEQFAIPETGGMRVLISTKPWQGGAGGAPFAGGAGGMPAPRALSGEPRGEQADAPGMITIHVTYNDFKDSPAGVPVALVGYSADDTVSYQIQNTGADGRVKFTDLDRSGGTSYFAMTLLPRNNGVDRLISTHVVLDSQVGVRMVLSSEKRDATAPPIDDFAKVDAPVDTPAGKVRVALEGVGDQTAKVTLIDAATRKVLAEGKPERTPPDPSRVQAEPQYAPDASLPAGTLDVQIVGGPGQTEEPLRDLTIRMLPASSNDAGAGVSAATGADGTARMVVQAAEPQKVVLTINGRELVSPPMDVTKSGGKLVIRAHWEDSGRPAALLDVAGTQGQVVYAECDNRGQHYRSMPFQLLDGTGTKVTIYVFPRVLFRFELEADAEDEQFVVRGSFEVTNYSWAPYRGGPDGLLLPMPHGFSGARLADSDQAEVSIAPGEGYRIIRPIPPGGRKFRAAFGLPVDAGRTAWALDLPLGVFESQLVIKQTPGMTLQTPKGVQAETRTVPQGTFSILAPLTIRKGQSMVMTIDGLPSPPQWRAWVQRIVGLLVIAMLLGGLGMALLARRPAQTADAEAEARRQRLLDELVELERSGANPKRREQLLAELEQLWG